MYKCFDVKYMDILLLELSITFK